MPLPFAPHSVTVMRHEQKKDARRVAGNVAYTQGATLSVCINSKDPAATFNDYGVEWSRPHRMLLDIADAAKVSHLDLIKWGSRTFRVETPVRVSQHGLPTDHASAMLEELES